MTAAAGYRGRYCMECNKGYRKGRKHRCGKICPSCYSVPTCERPGAESPFRRKATSENLGEGTSAGTALQAEVEERRVHDNDFVGESERENGRVAFAFYDFETRQDETLEGTESSVKVHVPILCVAQQICETYVQLDDMTKRCRWCGRELVKYCRNDVDILRRACMAFRKIFLERGNVCPFEECTTIASTCMKVFRKNLLREEEIGLFQEAATDSQITIRTGYPINRNKPLLSANREDTLEKRYETIATTRRLEAQGYRVIEKWECVFDQDLRENDEMREFVANHPVIKSTPLNPRDAFFDGCMGNIATYCEVTGTEKIRYVDVCSLYLYILKTGGFPIGHPAIYIGQECSSLIGAAPDYNFDSVEGLVQRKVLPLRDLFHLVLPYRVRGKLLFALCRSCCETFSQAECTHDQPVDREFEGTWVSCEVRKAIEKSYFVTSEASGWPGECVNDEAKERYLREYEETEGLRSVAKLCLNSFWGKFGQRSNLPQTVIIKDYQQFVALLINSEHEITDILPVNDERMYVSWRLREEAVTSSPMTNVVIAAYTTAQARLKLYEYLELLDRRVLYYDTDSCIYLSTGDPGEYEPSTGNFLGDMTDELESYGRGSYIESFVSGGPKFYAYVKEKSGVSEEKEEERKKKKKKQLERR
ncbi:PREDICTED: uncharacterized protein LOC105448009 [Wasmannia auropunctata]|uniref:uncharacterized protein LOC105448009 n=1 Tax=Wasmannia auropunctata TaxID=64793 RepID=UPI0005F08B60|nr:PREDICTED: uncharacterized protein LOC105448009 [Wasmannia auropunctata]